MSEILLMSSPQSFPLNSKWKIEKLFHKKTVNADKGIV